MERIASGDQAAWRGLCDRLLPRALTLAKRLLHQDQEAEEVTWEAFSRLWQQAPSWQPLARIDTWLYRVIHNLAMDRLRNRREWSPLEMAEEEEDTAPSPLQHLLTADRQRQVRQALANLPLRQREAITLIHFLDVGVQQACGVMQVGREALESLLARGRRKLRSQLASLKEDC
ncbi:MAG: sigma-70 family RNA polymerase sigma factor [Magnetococcales bacterium]|nr:sigma-70 family RNA polymerase sigma factor [Magnetococcales bacterium]NGZ27175.1 sigma-70 family RNA polymerase sigma factor [Magnetococcales bacterium]